MAKRYVLLDDLSGKELDQNTSATRLTYGNITYDLYLSEDSSAKLDKALAPFITDAEQVQETANVSVPPGTRRRRTEGERAQDEAERAEKARQRAQMASWASDQNDQGKSYAVPGDRGRVSVQLVDDFYTAHPDLDKVWS